MNQTFLLTLILFYSSISFAQNVNIPDSAFKAYLVSESSINTNGDTEIQLSEASAFTGKISSTSPEVADLTGLEAFGSLTELEIIYGTFPTIDLSQNTQLATLTIKLTSLKNIDLSANTMLEDVFCEKNDSLVSLDASKCTVLELLYCRYNGLTSVAIPPSSMLKTILCKDNKLTQIDLSPAPNLTTLDGEINDYTTIDFSQNPELSTLKLSDNPIASLNLAPLTKLGGFTCNDCGLTEIDLTKNTDLTTLTLSRNKLTTLDLSQNNFLRSLTATNNDFETLDFTGYTSLQTISLVGCKLKHLDLSELPNITTLNLSTNPLETINIANGNNKNISTFRAIQCPELTCIQVDDTAYCQENWKLIDSAVSKYKLICKTPSLGITEKQESLYLYPNPTSGYIYSDAFASSTLITIYNTLGKEVVHIENTSEKIDVSSLSSGSYTIHVLSEAGLSHTKFLKH